MAYTINAPQWVKPDLSSANFLMKEGLDMQNNAYKGMVNAYDDYVKNRQNRINSNAYRQAQQYGSQEELQNAIKSGAIDLSEVSPEYINAINQYGRDLFADKKAHTEFDQNQADRNLQIKQQSLIQQYNDALAKGDTATASKIMSQNADLFANTNAKGTMIDGQQLANLGLAKQRVRLEVEGVGMQRQAFNRQTELYDAYADYAQYMQNWYSDKKSATGDAFKAYSNDPKHARYARIIAQRGDWNRIQAMSDKFAYPTNTTPKSKTSESIDDVNNSAQNSKNFW